MNKFLFLFLLLSLIFHSPSAAYSAETVLMTLEECIQSAEEHNRSLLAAKEKIEEAKMGLLDASGNFLPSLSISGNYTRLDEEPRPLPQPLMPPGAYISADRYSMTGTVQLPLFTGFRNRAAYRSASKAVRMEEENYRRQKNDLKFEITEAFYRAILAGKLVELNRESQKRLERHMEQTRTLYENGLASRLDLLRSEVQYSNMKPRIIDSENNLRMARNSLALLIGVENIAVFPDGELEVEKIEPDLGKSIIRALENRPEIILARLQKSAAGYGVTIARSAAYPQVNATYNRSIEHPDGMQDEWGGSWTLMVNVSLPIFRGFSTYSDTARARSRLRQLEHNFKQLRESIRIEVENAYHTLIKEDETINALEKNAAQAREAFRIARRQYSDGIISHIEFMDSELDYMQAQTNLLSSKSDYIIAVSRLRQATGGE